MSPRLVKAAQVAALALPLALLLGQQPASAGIGPDGAASGLVTEASSAAKKSTQSKDSAQNSAGIPGVAEVEDPPGGLSNGGQEQPGALGGDARNAGADSIPNANPGAEPAGGVDPDHPEAQLPPQPAAPAESAPPADMPAPTGTPAAPAPAAPAPVTPETPAAPPAVEATPSAQATTEDPPNAFDPNAAEGSENVGPMAPAAPQNSAPEASAPEAPMPVTPEPAVTPAAPESSMPAAPESSMPAAPESSMPSAPESSAPDPVAPQQSGGEEATGVPNAVDPSGQAEQSNPGTPPVNVEATPNPAEDGLESLSESDLPAMPR
jgi:hypothetical protein